MTHEIFHRNFTSLQSSTRSSRPAVFCKKGVLRNCAKFTGKRLCQRVLNYHCDLSTKNDLLNFFDRSGLKLILRGNAQLFISCGRYSSYELFLQVGC